jgi:hypothetical protein
MTMFGVLAGVPQGKAQTTVLVDPAIITTGYMNVFALPANGGGYQFGSGWGASDLRATYAGSLLTLRPCTNVSNPTDTYWVKPDGTGNKQMDANWYHQADNLLGSNITFSGNVVSYAMPSNYTCTAFIKVFNANFSTVLQQATQQLTNGQTYLDVTGSNAFFAGNSFFKLNVVATNPAAAHIQYGFESIGPNAPATNNPDTSFLSIRTASLDPTNALVNPGFEAGLSGWTTYGNGGNIETTGNHYYNQNNPTGALPVLVYEGLNVQKVFPTFTGSANYSGIYQDIPTGPGSTWAATAKCLSASQDQIGVWQNTGTNQMWMEVTFRDSSDTVLATYKSPIIDATSPPDTWIDMRVTNDIDGGIIFTAPAGATKVRLQEVYYQPYGYAGGSVYADSMVLDNLSPSDPNIITLPSDKLAQVGDTVTFTVVASGATPISYQWQTNGVNLVNGGGITGVTSNKLTLANVQKSQAGIYTVTITDTAGSLNASANLQVQTCDEAQNALQNPSFETGVYSPWIPFNGGGLKTNGQFWAGITVSNFDGIYGSEVENGGEYDGLYQDIPASPGQIFTADAWFFQPSSYPLSGGGQTWLEVQFRNGGTPLALYKSYVMATNGFGTNNVPLDTWINLQATNGYAGDFNTPIPNAYYLVAPPNTTVVRYQVTMHLVPGTGASGGVLYDAMHFMKKIPVTVNATRSAGSITLSWLSQCSTSYQIVYKDKLSDGWSPLGLPIPGNGGVVSSPPLSTSLSHRYYSVQTQ